MPSTPDDLLIEFPSSTPAERARFLRARKSKLAEASVMLRAHLEWRAASLPASAGAKLMGRELAEWVVVPDGLRAVDGTIVVVALPALCDPAGGSGVGEG